MVILYHRNGDSVRRNIEGGISIELCTAGMASPQQDAQGISDSRILHL